MMTTNNADDTNEATYTDFGEAVARLQESMDGLSTDMSGLERATQKLADSTQDLSDKQRDISEQMARTADEIRTANRSTARIDASSTAAPADD